VYEWSPTAAPNCHTFTIRFISPDEPGPRDFHVEPLLRRWVADEPTPFLDRACAYGTRALAEFRSRPAQDEQDEPDDWVLYRLYRALFRNRDEGRLRVGRLFKDTRDFVECDPGAGVSLLTPGLGDGLEASAAELGGAALGAIAERLLRRAIRSSGRGESPARAGRPDVIRAYEALCAREVTPGPASGPCAFPLNERPGRDKIDLLFTDGLDRSWRRWPAVEATEKVRTALMCGPVSASDLAEATHDRDLFGRCVRTLWRAVTTLTPDAFDRWLMNARTHGYLPLVGGTRLKGDQKKVASLQAQRIYCGLTWLAYERMARCYGALMLRVYVDFCLHAEREPTDEERWLFRQRHIPQLYLACLPLDFLGKPQVRWVIRGLTRFWRDLVVEPERYDSFTDLLGLFGLLVRSRREADRRSKERAARGRSVSAEAFLLSGPAASTDDHLAVEAGLDPIRWLSSRNCLDCKDPLQPREVLDATDPSRARVRCYCGRCDKEGDYYIDLGRFTQQTANG
jgi:hypothetical protein